MIADTVDPTLAPDENAAKYQKARRDAGDYVGDVTLRLVYGEVTSPWFGLTNFRAKDVPELDERDFRERRLVPTVWLPHEEYANSPGNPEFCESGGFGPFRGQLFVGDVTKLYHCLGLYGKRLVCIVG